MQPSIAYPRKKVLVVDDDLLVRRFVRHIMQSAGFDVQCAADGCEGLDFFGIERWDLAILDRTMPKMGGEQMAAAMKVLSPATPLILMTGCPAAVSDAQLFECILAKPFHPTDLLGCVNGIL